MGSVPISRVSRTGWFDSTAMGIRLCSVQAAVNPQAINGVNPPAKPPALLVERASTAFRGTIDLPHFEGHSKLGNMNVKPAFLTVTMTMSMRPMDMFCRVWIAR